MDYLHNRYPILGYIFGFFSSLPGEIFMALILGFIGAFGGWVFERFIRYADKKLKEIIEERKEKKLTITIMEKLRSFFTRILSIYGSIGVILMTIGSQGIINFPEWLTFLFSEDVSLALGSVFDTIITAIGAFLSFIQLVRAPFITEKLKGEVSTLDHKELRKVIINPFRVK
jgi:hypothetical protein